MRRKHVLAIIVVALVIAGCISAAAVSGCNDRPSAPPLRDERVYDNSHVGLRFLTPEGWPEVARADRPPPGPGDHLLIRFQSLAGKRLALFEVTAQDEPISADVAAILREPSHSMSAWSASGAPEPATIGGEEGLRYRLTQKDMTKEAVAVRHRGKLYLFTLIAPTADTSSRDQIRQILQGAKWTK